MYLRPSVRPHRTRSPLDKFSLHLIFEYFRKSVEEVRLNQNLTRITSNLHKEQYKFLAISRSVLLRIKRSSLDKISTENQNTRFMFRTLFYKIVPFMRKCETVW
jgi:hypothetical protein